MLPRKNAGFSIWGRLNYVRDWEIVDVGLGKGSLAEGYFKLRKTERDVEPRLN